MDFRTELSKWGYNKGNSIDVEILVNEIIPSLFSKQKRMYSEEDLKRYGEFCVAEWNGYEAVSLTEEFFEQFKKK
jgi:hypothetical protein